MHNPESVSKITADPRSTEPVSKSANPLNLPQKSTIRAIFKAKSADPKTIAIFNAKSAYPINVLISVF